MTWLNSIHYTGPLGNVFKPFEGPLHVPHPLQGVPGNPTMNLTPHGGVSSARLQETRSIIFSHETICSGWVSLSTILSSLSISTAFVTSIFAVDPTLAAAMFFIIVELV
jgi:hypothetical protein